MAWPILAWLWLGSAWVAADTLTGGGVAMGMGDEGMMVVTRGEDILSLLALLARTAF